MIVVLLLVVKDFTPSFQSNMWRGRHSKDGSYSVASAYSFLLTLEFRSDCQESLVDMVISSIWSSWALSKIIIFSWLLVQDMIPIRDNLLKISVAFFLFRGCILSFFSRILELSDHLIMICEVGLFVWYTIFRWMSQFVVLPKDPLTLFQMFLSLGGTYRLRKQCPIM